MNKTRTGEMKQMLVFIDESGDTGLKIGAGSSEFFTLGLVLFENSDAANCCDKKISRLRQDLGFKKGFEFHFNKNNDRTRRQFFKTLASGDFSFSTLAIHKNCEQITAPTFQKKEPFYMFACDRIFVEILPFLEQATVILDQIGTEDFRVSLRKRLTSGNTKELVRIKRVEQRQSHKENLLQVADYIASLTNWRMKQKAVADQYFQMIRDKEYKHEKWP